MRTTRSARVRFGRGVGSAIAGLAGVVVCLAAGSASAVPITYPVVGGSVDIQVRLGGVTIGSVFGVALIGDHVTVDAANLSLDSMRLDIAPTSIALSQPFGGYDQITIESASLSGGPTFQTLSAGGVPDLFTAAVGPLLVDGSWGATDSTGVNSATSGNPISFDVVSLAAIVNVNPLIELNAVTINAIDGTPFGHPGQHLSIVATYVVTTPEPGTVLLLGFGLALLGANRDRLKGRRRS